MARGIHRAVRSRRKKDILKASRDISITPELYRVYERCHNSGWENVSAYNRFKLELAKVIGVAKAMDPIESGKAIVQLARKRIENR